MLLYASLIGNLSAVCLDRVRAEWGGEESGGGLTEEEEEEESRDCLKRQFCLVTPSQRLQSRRITLQVQIDDRRYKTRFTTIWAANTTGTHQNRMRKEWPRGRGGSSTATNTLGGVGRVRTLRTSKGMTEHAYKRLVSCERKIDEDTTWPRSSGRGGDGDRITDEGLSGVDTRLKKAYKRPGSYSGGGGVAGATDEVRLGSAQDRRRANVPDACKTDAKASTPRPRSRDGDPLHQDVMATSTRTREGAKLVVCPVTALAGRKKMESRWQTPSSSWMKRPGDTANARASYANNDMPRTRRHTRTCDEECDGRAKSCEQQDPCRGTSKSGVEVAGVDARDCLGWMMVSWGSRSIGRPGAVCGKAIRRVDATRRPRPWSPDGDIWCQALETYWDGGVTAQTKGQKARITCMRPGGRVGGRDLRQRHDGRLSVGGHCENEGYSKVLGCGQDTSGVGVGNGASRVDESGPGGRGASI
ncbi:hypothetical protein BC629DRAFT_1630715 [Irpex lacteus]|nr:hypothetical protein BC629DRAFT_1630715 [Irpex lacteus]